MNSVLDVRGAGEDALAVRSWEQTGEPKAVIVLVHGIGEHSGRYERVGRWLSKAGYRVIAPDLPGFGRSGGRRAYVESFDDYLDVVERLLGEARDLGVPVVLYGHSMGGLISLDYALSGRPAPDLLVLSAPAADAVVPGWQKRAAPFLSRVAPTVSLPNPIDGEQLSRDPAVGEAYFADPLVHTSATASLGAALFGAMDRARADLQELSIPTYLLQGGTDPIVLPEFTAPIGEVDCVTRRLWPELRHECHNEPEGEAVIGEVIDWLDGRIT